jgi:hypothetical protein
MFSKYEAAMGIMGLPTTYKQTFQKLEKYIK